MGSVKKIPLDDSYLEGLNPVTPSFGEPELEREPDRKKVEKKKVQIAPKDKTEYESVFLAPAGGGKKAWRVYVTEIHYDRLNTIVKRLSTETQQQTIVGYLWNVLEDHFRTHGRTIAELIDKTVQTNPFDEFK